MFLRLGYLFVISLFFVFMVSCSDNSKKVINDESGVDSDTTVITDTDEIDDLIVTDEDIVADTDEISDSDSVSPVIGVNGKIWVESGSAENKEVTFYECGTTEVEASANTDEDGVFEIEAVLEKGKIYCVESGKLASCFTAEYTTHTANINPMTHLAVLVEQKMGKCSDLRKAETAVRSYLKVATANWLGELNYNALPGIQEGFESVKGLKDKAKTSEILAFVVTDLMKTTNREFEELFNGFVAIPQQDEVIIENTTTPVLLDIAGGDTSTAPGFKIEWLVMNAKTVGAQSEIWSDNPGEFTVKAFLYKDGSVVHIAQGVSSVTFFNIEKEGVINVSDLSADMSYWVSDGMVAIFAAGTEITKNGTAVSEIEYKLLSGGSSQIAKVVFSPSGTVFANDPMFFIVDLGTVFSGDPIMLGVERTDESGEISVLNQASGDPIMLTASGDPIMFTASGDPIMNIASGDPIMLGSMSNVLVTATNHFSDFAVKRKNIPVKTAEILDRWESDVFANGTPFMFITESIVKYKITSADELTKYFSGRFDIQDIEGDVDRLFNMQVGNVKNINIFENYFYLDSMIKRFKERKAGTENEKFAAIYKGFDIRNIIYEMYLRQMSRERSVTMVDLFDRSLVPETFIKSDISKFPDIRNLAANALLKITDADLKKELIVTKKDALDLLGAITLSGGPAFGVLNGMLTPDQVVCAWLSGKSLSSCKTTPVVFSINSDGNVEMDGTEVTETQIDIVFSTTFKALPEAMSVKKKHNFFRTLYLIISYGANLYENGPAVTLLSDGLKKMVFEMFDGMETGGKAIKLVDYIDNSFNTVSVVDGAKYFEVPIFSNIVDLLSQIQVVVPGGLVETDVLNSVSIKINGLGYIMNTAGESDVRPGYEIDSNLGIQTFTMNDIDYLSFPKQEIGYAVDLATLFSESDLNVFGSCFADVSVVVISTVDGKKFIRTKTYKVNVGSIKDAESYDGTMNSRPALGEIQVSLYNNQTGQIMDVKNGGVVLMPGNIVMGSNGQTSMVFKNLKPAIYTVEGFADGYYTQSKTVVLNKGNTEFITLYLNTVQTGTEIGTVNIGFNKRSAVGGTEVLTSSDVLDVFVLDSNGIVIKEFKGHSGADNLSVPNLKYGQYSLKVVSNKFYTALQSFYVQYASFEVFVTLETKNVCGNKIVEPGEECDNGYQMGNSSLKCKDLYSDALYPENTVTCSYSCTYNSATCYTVTR